MIAFRTAVSALGVALAATLAAPVDRRRLRRSARRAGAQSPLAARSLLQGGGESRQPPRCGRPARPYRLFDRRRSELEAGERAGELGPDRRVLRRRQAGLGGRPRRRDPAHRRRWREVGAATLRPRGQRPADRRDGAQGRRGAGVGGREEAARRSAALQGAGRRQAVPRRLVRRRAKRLRRRRVQPDLSHRATAARRGSPGSTAPTTRNSSTSTRSVRRRASSSSPAKAASC